MKKFLLISLLLLIALPALAIPQKIYIQGILKDANDNKLDGTYSIVFKIYDVATGGTALWQETQSNVQVDNGLYTVVLGSNTAFPSNLFSNDNLYVGIQVGSESEMSPRIQMLSGPFAFNAETLDGYAAGNTSGNIPISNGTLNTNLNADLLDGKHASDFALTAGSYVLFGPISTQSTPSATAIWVATSNSNGIAVSGEATSATGTNFGGYFSTNSSNGYGLETFNSGTGLYVRLGASNYNGYFRGNDSTPCVGGLNDNGNIGVLGGPIYGVLGGDTDGYGVWGTSNSGNGIRGRAINGYGGYFRVTSTLGTALVASNEAATGNKYYARLGSNSYAGYFSGPVYVSGFLTKAGGGFVIDHPQDPKNKVLVHSFVESPEMKNIYNGIITLDEKGEAVVELPSYFEALNRNFTYQLTTIGGYANVYIKEEVKNNKFKIAGGKPDMKVSWQVTGIRQDTWAKDHPIVVEKEKKAKGTYLYPPGFAKK